MPPAPARRRLARQLMREASAELAQLRRIRGPYRRTARRIARAQARLALAAALLAASLAEPAFAGTPRFDNGVFGLANTASSAVPAFADLDGDGDLDASIGGYLGRIFFFENLELDAEACTDGIDNDGDGRTDFSADAGCASTSDTSELSTRQCDNGLDDDSDGRIDWRGDGTGDPQCVSLSDNLEAPDPPPPACGIGPELLLLTPSSPLSTPGSRAPKTCADRQRRAGRAPERKSSAGRATRR